MDLSYSLWDLSPRRDSLFPENGARSEIMKNSDLAASHSYPTLGRVFSPLGGGARAEKKARFVIPIAWFQVEFRLREAPWHWGIALLPQIYLWLSDLLRCSRLRLRAGSTQLPKQR